MQLRLAIITLLAASTAAATIGFGHIAWWGDSHTFINYANDVVHGTWNPHLQWRPPGYPVILLLTGTLGGTLESLIDLQAALGIAIAPLVYLTIAPTDRTAAMVAALAVVASLSGVQFILTVYHTQAYIFGLVLTAFLMVRLMREPAPALVYAIAASCLFLASLRPTGYAVALACAVLALASRKAALRHAVYAGNLFVLAALAFSALQLFKTEGAVLPSSIGAQLFYNPYMRGQIAPQPDLPAELLAAQPTAQGYWATVDKVHDRVLLRAAVIALDGNALATVLQTIRHLRGLSIGPSWQFHDNWQPAQFFPLSPHYNDPRPRSLAVPFDPHWLPTPSHPTAAERRFNESFAAVYRVALPIAGILMLIGALGARRIGDWAPVAVATVYAGHLVPMAVLVDPQFRYLAEGVPLLIMGAGFGVAVIVRLTAEDQMRHEEREGQPAEMNAPPRAG